VGTPDRPLRLLSVGRLHWKKGHEHALAAVRTLVDDGIDVTYRIAGDGDAREPLQYAVRDLGLTDHVELLGARTADEVRELLAWADVFVHPSITEAFGVAVAEAQAMGVPVVCSDAGGLPENVADGITGIVVPRRDPVAIADAVRRLASDPGLRSALGLAGRRRAETLLGIERQLDAFEQVYRTALTAPAPERRLALRQGRAEARRHRLDLLREDVAGGRDAAELALWRREVVERVHDYVGRALPANARVLVISRGDESIVDFDHHRGEHFPQTGDGTYAGYHPEDSAAAIAGLETLREDGAEFLVIPATSGWWLEHYAEFARHLDRYARHAAADGSHTVYTLRTTTDVAA
jgi:hypothetical protein